MSGDAALWRAHLLVSYVEPGVVRGDRGGEGQAFASFEAARAWARRKLEGGPDAMAALRWRDDRAAYRVFDGQVRETLAGRAEDLGADFRGALDDVAALELGARGRPWREATDNWARAERTRRAVMEAYRDRTPERLFRAADVLRDIGSYRHAAAFLTAARSAGYEARRAAKGDGGEGEERGHA